VPRKAARWWNIPALTGGPSGPCMPTPGAGRARRSISLVEKPAIGLMANTSKAKKSPYSAREPRSIITNHLGLGAPAPAIVDMPAADQRPMPRTKRLAEGSSPSGVNINRVFSGGPASI
jgi:hypothetical protein